MEFDRSFRNGQTYADLLITAAFAQELEYLQLTTTQRSPSPCMSRQFSDHRRRNAGFPPMYGANAREQFLACSIFENVALGTCLQRAIDVFVAVVGCQNNHSCRWPQLPDRTNRADTVQFWHAQVNEGDVRLMSPKQLYR